MRARNIPIACLILPYVLKRSKKQDLKRPPGSFEQKDLSNKDMKIWIFFQKFEIHCATSGELPAR